MCFDPILRADSIFEGFRSFGDVLGELWKKKCFLYYTYYASRNIEMLMFFWKTMMENLSIWSLFKMSMKNILFSGRSIFFLCFCTRLAEISPKTHVSMPSCFFKWISWNIIFNNLSTDRFFSVRSLSVYYAYWFSVRVIDGTVRTRVLGPPSTASTQTKETPYTRIIVPSTMKPSGEHGS